MRPHGDAKPGRVITRSPASILGVARTVARDTGSLPENDNVRGVQGVWSYTWSCNDESS